MNKKKVSFVNPNFQQGPKEFNAYYLPYTSGVIWAYSNSFTEITDYYELGDFIWRRDKITDAIELLKGSDVVGFSTYIWNKNYNNTLAKELKKAYPNILIVFGGPEPPITNPDFFSLYPYIDICVKLEGEITFKRILERRLISNDYSDIPGILLNDNGKTIDTGDSERISELDTIPSPYLIDIFKPMIEKHPNIRWNGTLETNRGCPYQCTFCDWGSLTYNKVKKFDLGRIFNELEWFGQHQCDFITITDANFGIFVDRDNLIADKLIEVQKKYDNPKAYTISWAKNQKREVVEIVKKLIYEGGSRMGLNLSVQTMDDNTLDIIKRKNLDTNKIEEVFAICEEANIPLYTELILGLPGETLTSWKENFSKLYKSGNHTGLTIYQAQLLENAEMNLSQRKLYKIEGVVVYDYLAGTAHEDELKEGVEVVVSTRDLPPHIMIQAQVYSWMMNTFHINGITNYISRFLYRYKNLEYRDFYEQFFDYIQTDEWTNSEINRIKKYYSAWNTKGRIDHPMIGTIEIHGWNLIHSTLITIHNEFKFDHIFNVIRKFLLTFDLDDNIVNDLMNLQSAFFIDHAKISQYPIKISFDHDIVGYVSGGELMKPVEYIFEFPEDKNMSLQRFCEQIFFARRRNFGKALVIKG